MTIYGPFLWTKDPDPNPGDPKRPDPTVSGSAILQQIPYILYLMPGSDTLYYRHRYTVLQAQIHCTTGSHTLYYRLRYTVLQAQIQCTTGTDTLYYRLRYTILQAQIHCTCTTGSNSLYYRSRHCSVLHYFINLKLRFHNSCSIRQNGLNDYISDRLLSGFINETPGILTKGENNGGNIETCSNRDRDRNR